MLCSSSIALSCFSTALHSAGTMESLREWQSSLAAKGWINWKLGAAIAAPAALWWLASNKDWYSEPLRPTDFDSLLKQQGDHPTGLPPKTQQQRKKGTADQSGPFENFLKEDEEVDLRDPVVFSSFLKSASAGSSAPKAAAVAAAAAPAVPAGPKAEHVHVLVMFATEYGFAKEVAEKLCSKLAATNRYW